LSSDLIGQWDISSDEEVIISILEFYFKINKSSKKKVKMFKMLKNAFHA
jgi:hypothetical protein